MYLILKNYGMKSRPEEWQSNTFTDADQATGNIISSILIIVKQCGKEIGLTG